MIRPLLAVTAASLCACGTPPPVEPMKDAGQPIGDSLQALMPTASTARVQPVAFQFSAAPAFADERGGGLFIDLSGRVVRLRSDLSQGALASHPSNAVPPGPATAVWPMSASSGLVVTSRGLYVAEAGWLIAPPWQTTLPADGVRLAVTNQDDTWVAHERGLFRLTGGLLQELKVSGAPTTQVSALALGPTPSGFPGVWFVQGGTLRVAEQRAALDFSVHDAVASAASLDGGVLALAALEATAKASAEVWAITPSRLLRLDKLDANQNLATQYTLNKPLRALKSAGRQLALITTDSLVRYDADTQTWTEDKTFTAPPTLLALDATGTAWVRVGADVLTVTPAPPARVLGLLQSTTVFEPEAVVRVALPLMPAVRALSFHFDAEAPRPVTDQADGGLEGLPGDGPLSSSTRFFSLAGLDAASKPKLLPFSSLTDGRHTLFVDATLADGTKATRTLHFSLSAAATQPVSYARDIVPISTGRCAKCHQTGTEPELASYTQWRDNAVAISNAVKERRMPADGPLDPAGIQTILRWVNGGAQP